MMGSHDIPIVIISTHGWKINQQPEIPKTKFLRPAHDTTLPSFIPFCLLTKHQQNTNPNTTYLQAHKQIRQNIASLLEISQKEKRTHLRAQQQANIKLKKLENPWPDFCEIAGFISWKALPEENESCWRVSTMQTDCGV
jgi:hypothetical protein